LYFCDIDINTMRTKRSKREIFGSDAFADFMVGESVGEGVLVELPDPVPLEEGIPLPEPDVDVPELSEPVPDPDGIPLPRDSPLPLPDPDDVPVKVGGRFDSLKKSYTPAKWSSQLIVIELLYTELI
jgi:hypothetical protein